MSIIEDILLSKIYDELERQAGKIHARYTREELQEKARVQLEEFVEEEIFEKFIKDRIMV